jgi:hypothetical protein
MAQAKYVPIFTGTTGLDNTVDPVRLKLDLKTGITQLARAVNVDVDKSGRVNRRLGYQQKSATACTQSFADGEKCYVVAGATLRQLNPDYSFTTLRSDLTPGLRMSFWPIAGRVYYTNGSERGYIAKSQDNVWTAGTYAGIKTNRTFSDPPKGHLVSWFGGRALVAVENVVFASEPSQYGRFDLAKTFRAEADRITMLSPTSAGLLVGTKSKTVLWKGDEFLKLQREVLSNAGVVEGSLAFCEPGDLPKDTFAGVHEGRVNLFVTPNGICALDDRGNFVKLTDLDFPTSQYATAAVHGGRYLVLIQP